MTDAAPTEKAKMRSLIAELTERMVKALDAPDGKPDEQGKETATFGNLCSALDRACAVYRLFTGTGDFDDSGSELDTLRGKFHARGNKGGERAGNRGRTAAGNGAGRGLSA